MSRAGAVFRGVVYLHFCSLPQGCVSATQLGRGPYSFHWGSTTEHASLTPVVSSLNAGAKMEGLSVFKDVPDPVALPEDQYPNWLWTLLDKPKGQPVVLEGERNFMAERKSMRDR